MATKHCLEIPSPHFANVQERKVDGQYRPTHFHLLAKSQYQAEADRQALSKVSFFQCHSHH